MPFGYNQNMLLERVYEIAAGRIDGVEIVKKFGFNPLVGATKETVWDAGGLYQYAGTGVAITISSSSTDDDLAGIGAQTATVYGVDEDYNSFAVDVEMDGQNTVPVIANGLRVFRVIVNTSGSAGSNVGTIYVGYGAVAVGVPANTLAVIRPTFNQTQMAVYTVPAGKIAFLGDYYNNTGQGKDATVESYARPFGGVFQLKRIVSTYENNFYYPNRLPFFFDEKTDLELRAASIAAGAPVSAGFDLIVVDKDLNI